MRSSLLLALGLLMSCTHVKAGDQTVAEHRNEAALLQQQASREREKYVPTESERVPPRAPRQGVDGIPEDEGQAYNPTIEHLITADQEMREANEHLVAARQLLAFTDVACEGMSKGERSACPLFASSVKLVETTKTGFVLTFNAQANVPQTHRRLSCHLAYAVATGFDKPSCPLFIKGTTLQRVGDDGIEFMGETEPVAQALKTQARRVFLGVDEPYAAELLRDQR